MWNKSRYNVTVCFLVDIASISIKRIYMASIISLVIISSSLYGLKHNYTVYAIGDSNTPYAFRNMDQSGADVFFNKEIPTYRSVTLDNNQVVDTTYYICGLSGHPIYKVRDMFLGSFINPDLIPTLDFIIFGFGTIDARTHAYHQSINRDVAADAGIEQSVILYIQNILSIKQRFPEYKGKLVVMASLPVCHTWESDRELAIYINNLFNASLKKHAEANGMYFFNPFLNYTNEQGFMDETYECDKTHFRFEYNYLLAKEAAIFFASCND